jgi:matrix metalloproteinase-14 (membrane-inserted)
MLRYSLFIILLSHIDVVYNADKIVTLTFQTESEAFTYLNEYGYNPCADSTGMQCSVSFSTLLKDFQKRFHLNTTGILDEATKQLMSQPRCGNKDSSVSLSKRSVASLRRKWSSSTLTWSLRNYAPYIHPAESQRAIHQAFDLWSRYIPLSFIEVCPECSPNLVIDFGYGHHGDEFPFDGPGGRLAHAFYPEDGRIHFDMEEPWTIR